MCDVASVSRQEVEQLHEELVSAINSEDLDRILPKFIDSSLNRRKKLEEWGYA